ncbi:MAG TPA: type II toxin-antitoxin system VapC family toxin [Rhizomicrobium sp.]|nr:type II toxin-antitoxin system VapC family toxin [Rhizomicrobium sp.]
MKPPFLLDTCACIWLLADTLPAHAVKALTDAFNEGHKTFVSPITAWEVGMQARKGRFKSHLPPQRWFATLRETPGMAVAPMPPEILIQSSELPDFSEGDPADRVFAATAREYGYTLVTADRALLDYGRQGYLSVVAC